MAGAVWCAEVGVFLRASASVLVQDQPVRVVPLHPLVNFPVKRRAQVAFISHRVNREGDVAPIRPPRFLKVPQRVKLRALGLNVVVVRKFRLEQDPRLVRRLKIFRERAVRVVPHVIEPRRPRKRQMLKEALAVRRLDEIDEIVVVIA